METSIKPLVAGDDLEKQWKFFQWQWDGFVTFNETRAAWSKEKQASALMHFIGLDCAYLYETATAAVKRDPDLLKDHISNIVKPVTNDCFERYLFKTFSRKEGEDVNLFVARCREKLDRCGYPAGYTKDFLIVDALVHNLSDLTLQQHFFRTKDLKLAKVIEDLQVHEAGQAQLKEIQTCRAKVTPVVSVNPVTESRSERQGRSRTRSSSSGARKPSRSRSSSKSRSYSKSRSSSKSKQGNGKDRRRSNSRSNHKSYRARSQTPKREKRFPIDPAKLSSKMWAEYVECDFGSIQVKLDTGAEVTVMPKRLLDKVRGRVYVLKPTPIVLEVYGGALLRPLGTIIFQNCVLNNTSLDLEFIVADVESVPLLCLDDVERYGLITRVTSNSLKPISSICKVSIHACKTATLSYPSVENPNQVNVISSKKVTFSDKCSSINNINEIISSNPEVFSTEAGCFPHLYSLEVDQSKRPIGVPSRRVPHSVKDRYKNYLSHLCDKNIIKKCENPRGYISPVVIVEKPDNSLRTCLDPKNLNEALYRPFYEILTKEDIISSVIANDLENTYGKYTSEDEVLQQKKSVMIESNIPDLPYEQVSADILEYNGQYYLVVIDSYSKWLDALQIQNKTSKSVIDALHFLFSIHGIPRVLRVDNNPFKSYKFIEFSKQLNFKVISCSPHFHQSNGLAEKAYRITPISGLGASPAQLLMSRQLNSTLPVHVSKLKPSIVPNIKSKLELKSQTSKKYYDCVKPRKEIEYHPSDYVFMQNPITKNWEPGMVVESCDEPRSYMVKNEGTSKIVRRNEIFLKPRSATVFKSHTPVYMLPSRNQLVPQQEIQNDLLNNDNHVEDQQIVINNHQLDINLEAWREQVRNRFAQNNHEVVRTRTRVIKKPDRLNL
ncbi:hypothetical protein KUF71_004546 [Frankliniella fusca]|uniref:Integrase catalytic domain-containing protein n=1 Tax=Frankliniella fusca TaxID=407009 RepID=A0AAE1H030_9NEOP|nr:hypothetical protein KUF71_004546 [Frankliniella fusca]